MTPAMQRCECILYLTVLRNEDNAGNVYLQRNNDPLSNATSKIVTDAHFIHIISSYTVHEKSQETLATKPPLSLPTNSSSATTLTTKRSMIDSVRENINVLGVKVN